MRYLPHLSLIICSLTLSGCVAAPLAQMVVSQMPAPKPACPGCTTETVTSTFVSLSQGVSASFHKLTGPDNPNPAGDMPRK